MLLNKNDSLLVLVDVQQKLTPLILNHKQLVTRCEWLLKLAQRMGVPVLASEQYSKGLGNTVSPLSSYFQSEHCFEKVHFSCMRQPDYVQQLKKFNKKQLILIGIETHVCVLQTAIEMKEAGFDVFVVVDAVGSRFEIDMKYGLKRMKQQGIHLITGEMVFFEWVRLAGSDEFRSLSKDFLQ